MFVVLAVIAVLWIAALVLMGAASDSRGAVALALASNEEIIARPTIVRNRELVAA